MFLIRPSTTSQCIGERFASRGTETRYDHRSDASGNGNGSTGRDRSISNGISRARLAKSPHGRSPMTCLSPSPRRSSQTPEVARLRLCEMRATTLEHVEHLRDGLYIAAGTERVAAQYEAIHRDGIRSARQNNAGAGWTHCAVTVANQAAGDRRHGGPRR